MLGFITAIVLGIAAFVKFVIATAAFIYVVGKVFSYEINKINNKE